MTSEEDISKPVEMGRVSFRNTDAHGWMHNTEYGDVCEDARMHWLLKCGVSQKELQSRGLILGLKSAEETFYKGARLEQEISVATELVSIGATSMVFNHKVFCDDELSMQMKLVMVCVDAEKDCKTPIPEDVREKLQKHLKQQTWEERENARVHGSELLFQL